MAGQTDRFGQPIPAAPGYQTILNPDGSQPQMRNILYLGDGLTCVDEPNSEASRLNIDISVVGAVQQVNAATNLRNDLFLFGPDPDKIYVTKYYVASSDTGGMAYRWDATDNTTDDGVLHIKNSHHSFGRFRPIKPADGMINCMACGPALADVGSRTISFDPTSAVAIGSELFRVTSLLRNAGWSGISFGANRNGAKSYAFDGTERMGRSTAPWIPFAMVGVDGAMIVSFTPPSLSGFAIYGETEVDLTVGGYSTRYWTQTLAGGETVFPGVANIVGLSVGDTVMVRLGADNSDESGVCYCYYFGVIKTITPGTGTTGTVETWECVPEPPSSVTYPLINNTLRQYNKHDMVKMVGFQDNTVVRGFTLNRTSFGVSAYRDLTIDCTWLETPYCINGLYGTGMQIPRIVVAQDHGYPDIPEKSCLIILAKQYDTHIGTMIIHDMSPRGGTLASVLTCEALCRGTRIDFADITFNTGGGASEFCGQTFYQTDLISVGMLVVKGTSAGALVGSAARIECIDYKGALDVGFLEFPWNTQTIVFAGQLYTQRKTGDYVFPVLPSVTKIYSLPNHGLTDGFRLWMSSMTGVIGIVISGNGFVRQVDVTSTVTAGSWIELGQASGLFGFLPNQAGYNGLQVRIDTNGSFPAGGYMAVKHSAFEIDLSVLATSVPDTSVPSQVVTNGAPTANSSFIGQDCFDSTNSVWYKSVATGTGASDWKPAGAGGAIQANTSALGSIDYTEISAPSAPSAGKVRLYASATGTVTSKDPTSVISVMVNPLSAVTSNWVKSLSANGVMVASQPSSLDLSDLAPVALTNADATITVAGGSYYSLAASTLTGLHTLTLSNTSATDKQAIQVRVFSQGSNYLINDSAAALLLSVASGTKVVATFVWNTGTGKFQLQSWNFFT